MRSEDDARYRPMPGDTRQRADGRHTRTVTRATDWAVESHVATDRRPEDSLRIESIAEWAAGGEWGYTYAPKVRTAEDARLDPLPGDTKHFRAAADETVVCHVVARDGDTLTVRVDTSEDDWPLSFWSGGDVDWGDSWVPA